MQPTSKRKATIQGLGDDAPARDEKITLREEDASPPSRQNIACPPPSKGTPVSGFHRKHKEGRPPPVAVDCVGDAAVALASRARRSSVPPRLLKATSSAEEARLGPESLRILSLVDGRTGVDGLARAAGIPRDRVETVLDRLARLGFVSRA